MSRKKRALERQKLTSKQRKKAKQKAYYNSWEAKQKWIEKKASKEMSQLDRRQAAGIPAGCPLPSFKQHPTPDDCFGCNCRFALRFECSYLDDQMD